MSSKSRHRLGPSSWPWQRVPQVDVVDEKYEDSLNDGSRVSEEHAIELLLPYRHESVKTRRLYCLTVVNFVVLVISTLLFLFVIFSHTGEEFNAAAKAASFYSPILDMLPIHQDVIRLNGTLFPPDKPSWSRLPPGSPEGEAGWQYASDMRLFPISSSEVHSLGKDTEHVARFDPAIFPDLGEDAYVATLDLSHQVHCLNELRKMAFVDYPYEKGDDGGDWDPTTGPKLVPPMTRKEHSRVFWVHLRHCTDMLLQNLLCHADTELFTFGWLDTQINPYPDFNINKVCRRWEDLIAWRDERADAVDTDIYGEMRRPESVRPMKAADAWYRMIGYHSSVLFDSDGKLLSKDD